MSFRGRVKEPKFTCMSPGRRAWQRLQLSVVDDVHPARYFVGVPALSQAIHPRMDSGRGLGMQVMGDLCQASSDRQP